MIPSGHLSDCPFWYSNLALLGFYIQRSASPSCGGVMVPMSSPAVACDAGLRMHHGNIEKQPWADAAGMNKSELVLRQCELEVLLAERHG